MRVTLARRRERHVAAVADCARIRNHETSQTPVCVQRVSQQLAVQAIGDTVDSIAMMHIHSSTQ
jgi:hypothetical protein